MTLPSDAAQARAEYEAATKDRPFTKDFNAALEALINDPAETIAQRVLAWLKLRAWGNFRLYAVNKDGTPAFQSDCALDLKLKKQLVSKAVAYWKLRGYLDCKGKLLYPVISPSPPALPEKSPKKSPEWVTFLQLWQVTHSVDFAALEEARSVVKRLRKVMLSDYRESQRALTKKLAIKEESSLESSERSPSSVGRSSSGVLETPPAREDPTDRPNDDLSQNPFKPQIREWLEDNAEIPGFPLEEPELEAIADTIHTEEEFKQFQEAAKRQENPRGWRVFVRIAQACKKRGPTKANGSDAENNQRLKDLARMWELRKQANCG